MLRLVYVSTALLPFDDAALVALLDVSRANNARDGITGMLLHNEGNFLQVLEGDAPRVRALHERIRRDRRHHRMLDVLEEPAGERLCPDWAMGFVPAARLADPGLAAFTPLLLPGGDAARSAGMHGAVRALDTFRQSVR